MHYLIDRRERMSLNCMLSYNSRLQKGLVIESNFQYEIGIAQADSLKLNDSTWFEPSYVVLG